MPERPCARVAPELGDRIMVGTVYSNLRDAGGREIGIRCDGGKIEAIETGLTRADAIDCGGKLVLPAFVEPHVHLDKTLWGEPWVPGRPATCLKDYIDNERRVLSETTTPPETRAARLLAEMLRHGTTAVRSHVDVAPDIGLRHVEAMLRLREAWHNRIDLQFVAFPQQGLMSCPGTTDLIREAIDLGVETIGGLDPAGMDGDPTGQLGFIFDLAASRGTGIDIHLHDLGELGAWQVELIAEHVEATGLVGRVMISHAYCLGMIPEGRLESIGRRLADLEISLMTSAPAEIAVPPVERLTEIGVNVCCGSDGIRDAWSPFGTGDMLERAFLTAYRFDWNSDADFARALHCATEAGARAIGIEDYGLRAGCRADFVIIDATTPGDALCRRPSDRRLVRAGMLVAA